MSNTVTNGIAENVENTLDVVARSLRDASGRTMGLSDEASEVLANAAAEVVRLAEKMRKHLVEVARDAARNATQEVKEHPIASVAAALAAVAAVAGMIAASRSSKMATK